MRIRFLVQGLNQSFSIIIIDHQNQYQLLLYIYKELVSSVSITLNVQYRDTLCYKHTVCTVYAIYYIYIFTVCLDLAVGTVGVLG